MKDLYLEHKADSCVIAEVFATALGENRDKHKRLMVQRVFCEKKCRFTNCSDHVRSEAGAR